VAGWLSLRPSGLRGGRRSMYAKNRAVKAVSAIPVLLVTALFIFEWYVYNFVFLLGKIAKNEAEKMERVEEEVLTYVQLVLGVLFNALWLLAFCSFLRCCLSDPGIVSEEWRIKIERDISTGVAPRHPASRSFAWSPGAHSTCRHCNVVRPERAHHCKVCGQCVLRMDHHCPWVGNCVGFKNHKFFILMNFYGFLACLVFVLSCLPQLKGVFMGGGAQIRVATVMGVMVFSLGALLAASFGVSLAMLFVAHCYLLLRNLTSVEVAFPGKNPYSLGPLHNAQQILGAADLSWLLPIHPMQPVADGCTYQTAEVHGDEMVSIMGSVAERKEDDNHDV